ncbi:hypothetical protein OOJ91_33890 [Micromonospora lupini]|uniref:hypothetical protein n=1 Tax=Micromonospora lupini TaxID=285679 RepID=UPI002253140D|nr:hypothetical protein [Micromonospora lupini]MCX5070840.1 hypothetical protein [Micromonospora lupini]
MSQDAAPPEGLSLRAQARLAHVDAVRDAAEYLIQQAPTSTDQHAAPGEYITAARRARLLALQLLDRAVLLELSAGATWDVVADRLSWPLDTVLARYEDMWKAWKTSPDAGTTAEQVDSWYSRVCPGAPPNAVSAGLF